MKNLMRVAVFSALLLVVSAASYPANYPYTNEKADEAGEWYLADIRELPEKTPSRTYVEATDVGGYIRETWFCDAGWNGIKGNDWSPFQCKGWEYLLNHFYQDPDYKSKKVQEAVNCTKPCFAEGRDWNTISKLADVRPYIKNTVKWGTGVCPELKKHHTKTSNNCMGTNSNDPDFDKKEKGYIAWNCKSTYSSQLYCDLDTGFRYQWACKNMYLSPTTRLYMRPCLNLYLRFYATCSLWGAHTANRWEPDPYVPFLTMRHWSILVGYTAYPDRICNPYSYYYPSFGKSASPATPAACPPPPAPAATPPAASPAAATPAATSGAAMQCMYVAMMAIISMIVFVW